MASRGIGLVVCTECPWRLRHEFPEPLGLVCRYHIARFDGAPAVDVISAWMGRYGFREDALSWVPTKWIVTILVQVRSKLR